MDPRFDAIFTDPQNAIFKVVFFPDRIYHAQYLNATRSPRYRYNVQEVRSKLDATVLKGEVYLDGAFLGNFLRVEYHAGRLVEQARLRRRFLHGQLLAWVKLRPRDETLTAEATIKLHFCRWTNCYQAEVWETLEPPAGSSHDFTVLDQMGRDAPITRVRAFGPALRDIKALRRLDLAFRENDVDLPAGYRITEPGWDNNYGRSHQEPRSPEPSSPQNTVVDENYQIDFERGWFLNARQTAPVLYRNAMMDSDNPERRDDNVIQMRWLVQLELGSSLVFFHEVTIPPNTIEGTHQHIGSEELYYICEGEGIAYMGANDSREPAMEQFPVVKRHIYGLGLKEVRELPVRAGSVIYTKSGGIHGIRNPTDRPLRFAAFLYHST